MNNLLFEIAPVQDEDGKKKKASRKKQAEESQPPRAWEPPPEQPVGYLASIEGHVSCETCGLEVVDLVEIVKVGGETKWKVMCGWWCLTSWFIDPIPGLLDEADKSAKEFVLREGRFAGKTFDEVWNSGNDWYVRDLVKMAKRTVVAEAAAAWLAKKGID